jgi:amino acid transporter
MSDSASSGRAAGLKRELGPLMLSVYGVGTILGAGIYVLIGKVAGEAGYWLPLAFLVAALAAGINGLVYGELASRQPLAGGPVAYVQQAFGIRSLTILLGWMIVTTGVVSAATITSGFAGYVGHFIDVAEWWPETLLLVALGGLAALGAKESAWFMAITTTIGVIGLLAVIATAMAAGPLVKLAEYRAHLPPLSELHELTALLSAAFLSVYAFIGFEDMVHLAEEVRRPGRAMPVAIVAAIGTAAALYILVSFAALALVTPEALADSGAPLVTVVEQGGLPGWPLALLSLWIIANGALAQIVMASRVIYGLGHRGGVPAWLARVNGRTGTPLIATFAVTAVAVALARLFPLETLAAATSFVILLVFAVSNLALIRLERRRPEAPFDTPTLLPWVGLAVCLVLIAGRLLLGGGGH